MNLITIESILNNYIDSEDIRNRNRFNSYFTNFLSKKSNLYRKNGLEDIPTAQILRMKSLNGLVAICKLNNEFVCGYAYGVGKKNKKGLYDVVNIVFEDGETVNSQKVNIDCVLLSNNNLMLSDSDFFAWYSKILADTDNSMNVNVVNCRVCKIPIARNDNEKRSIEEASIDVKKGKTVSIVNEQYNDPFDNVNENKDRMLELTSPESAVYLQNLSRFHDELMKRSFLECGIYITSRDKGAQMNEMELDSFKAYCTIGADDELEQLNIFCDNMKKVFNIDVTFEPKSFVQTEEELEELEEMKGDDMNGDNENSDDSRIN